MDDPTEGGLIQFLELFTVILWLSPGNFFGGGAKSIVMQISIVILLFSDQISGRGKFSRGGGANCLRGAPPCGRKPDPLGAQRFQTLETTSLSESVWVSN